MSLRSQFLALVILTLIVSLSFEGVLACMHARLSVDTEMRTALAASDQMVDTALVSTPQPEAATAYFVRLVRSFDGNRHVHVTLMVGKKIMTDSRLATPPPVPGWFSGLIQIHPATHRYNLSSGEGAAVLLLATDPRNEISEAWGQFRDSATILSLFSLMVLGLLYLVVTNLSAQLKKLAAGFDAVGSGDYTAHVSVVGPRELSRLGQAFNRMAVRLGGLEDANRRLNLQLQTIQEEERAAVARDLHDEMGPFLFAVRVDAEAIGSIAQAQGLSAVGARVRSIIEAVTHIQQHVRLILKQLRPAGLLDVGLAQAIANLATFWQQHYVGVKILLDVERVAGGFDEPTDSAIYRLVQEGLTNAVRHGGAREVTVAIMTSDDKILIHVKDNGTGLPMAGTEGGQGLRGMRERVAALDGTLTIGNRPNGQGAVITAEIPRKAQAQFEVAGAAA